MKHNIHQGHDVLVTLAWGLPHPDERVEWELWTNSNDQCGVKCDQQAQFIKDMAFTAKSLEQDGYTMFQPHYITWYCPPEYVELPECKGQCINNGRYCCPDPDEDITAGYSGSDVVLENLRQLCVWQQATDIQTPWLWWDYAVNFQDRCKMSTGNYTKECAYDVIRGIDSTWDFTTFEHCIGNDMLSMINTFDMPGGS